MDDIYGRIVVIVFGVILLLYVPIALLSLKLDSLSQSYVDNAVEQFVDDARASARITEASYRRLVDQIGIVQGNCELEINHGATYSIPSEDAHGDLVVLDTRREYGIESILDAMYPNDTDFNDYIMKEGDYLQVIVEAREPSLGAKMTGFFLPSYRNQRLYCVYGGYVGNEAE